MELLFTVADDHYVQPGPASEEYEKWCRHLWSTFQKFHKSCRAEDLECAWQAARLHNFMRFVFTAKEVYRDTITNVYAVRYYERLGGYGYFMFLEDCPAQDEVRRQALRAVLRLIEEKRDTYSLVRTIPVKYQKWYEEIATEIFRERSSRDLINLHGSWRLKPYLQDSPFMVDKKVLDENTSLEFGLLSSHYAQEVNRNWEYGKCGSLLPWIPLHLDHLPSQGVWLVKKDTGTRELVGQVLVTQVGTLGALFVKPSIRGHCLGGYALSRATQYALLEFRKPNCDFFFVPVADIETSNKVSYNLTHNRLQFDQVLTTFSALVSPVDDPDFNINKVFDNTPIAHSQANL